MLDRRSLFAATAAVGSFVGAVFKGRTAAAATYAKNATIPGEVEPRGTDGRHERLPTLDLESQHDFHSGIRGWNSRVAGKAAQQRVEKIMVENGLDKRATMSTEKALSLIEHDHVVGTSARTWISNQQTMWKSMQDYYHANADDYLAEMEAFDNIGPGTLELNPDMDIPTYTKHEIHMQPGGYVGDEFAGHMYHYGTNNFYTGGRGDNEQDQIHIGTAERMPLPEDGKVKRILVQGCGPGQFTVALKERFPDAEVWGIDVGGPLVRYGHMRAVELGVDVNFAQRLAEDTKFPDGYFDIVTSFIIHHELPADKTKEVFREAHRVTRKGGYFYPVDFRTRASENPAFAQYRTWWDHRWNTEVWSQEFRSINLEDELVNAGFKLKEDAKPVLRGFGVRHAIKQA
jgi:SAM-dependent methyltransferase